MGSVDVVVPCYQYGRFLRQCVTSVLDQDVPALRVLIIDNASTDDSVEVARQLAAEDRRVQVVARRVNQGPHASFNEGVDWAEAEYFLILCADDLLAPGALARAVAVMNAHAEVALTYGAAVSAPSDRPLPILPANAADPAWHIMPGPELLERLCRSGRNPIPGPTAIVRTSVQKRVGHYRKELTHTDDLEMWMRFACHGAVARTDAVQAIARTHSSNQSATVATIHHWNVEFEAAFTSFFDHEGARLADADRLRRTARKALGERAYWSALAHLCRGETGTARELWKYTWRVSPGTALLPPIGALLRRLSRPAGGPHAL
ncbi:MAG TPA: glycosyltransferase family A protein [Magnetospirillum sp.]|nr:glycosyltransferase family A protein [Magnetospirillum sp.]